MKHIFFTILLFVCYIENGYAQTSAWEKAYNDLPKKERDEYYENARHFLQNIYYNQIIAAIESVEIHPYLIEDLAGEEAGAARYLPEFLPEGGSQRPLTLAQYLMELCNTFQGKSEELEFVVNDVVEDKYVHGYNSPTNCFVRLSYDLEIHLHGQTLLKRPCRMCCLFPEAQYKKRIRLMQIEPVEEGAITPVVTASDDKRFQEAIEWYEQGLKEKYLPVFKELANKGCADAQYVLGSCYESDKDYTKAAEWYAKAAEQGHTTAQNQLCVFYFFGQGVPQNYEKAFEWASKSANQGNALGETLLGAFYEDGLSVPQDHAKAVAWYQKAAEQGYAGAQFDLGRCYLLAIGVPGNYTQAAEWFTKAANQGWADAQYYLGNLYRYGDGVYQSHAKAAEWYAKATEQGHLAAQYELGELYKAGLGIRRDEQKGLELITQSAEQGYAEAQFALGNYYNYEYETSRKYNSLDRYTQVIYWYTQAAEQGHANAQRYLGLEYILGSKVTQDYKKGAEWIKKAAEQGFAAAQYNLGQCYEKGEGVPKDLEKAKEWYAKAAAQGFDSAAESLKRLQSDTYVTQEEYERNSSYNTAIVYFHNEVYDKAIPIFLSLAERGWAPAQCQLGTCYYYGKGVQQNYYKAFEWYTKAASQGNATAQYNMGTCYLYGYGTTRNTAKAIEWYTKAANQGNTNAKQALARLKQP